MANLNLFNWVPFKRRPETLKPGLSPGTITVDPLAPQPVIQIFSFNNGVYVEKIITDIEEIPAYRQKYAVVWVNIDGLGDEKVIRRLGEMFDIHPLALEDVVNVHQIPKLEFFEPNYFVTLRMFDLKDVLESEQISIYFGKNFVVTFQERLGDCLDPVRERIRKGKGKILKSGADYLSYAIIDAITDHYFPLLEKVGNLIEEIENQVFVRSQQTDVLAKIYRIRADLHILRRTVWPLREVVNHLNKEESQILGKEARMYFRDLYDHTIQLMDLLEAYREAISSLSELYLSHVSLKMNEIMKVLTIISTIFIPLTFIVGIYGMNFNTAVSPWSMPELNWRWGYPLILLVILAVAVLMLALFYKGGWLLLPKMLRRKNNPENSP